MGVAPQKSKPKKIHADNRRASFDVAVSERIEAGIVLTSDEIKSIRAGRVQLQGGFVRVQGNKLVVIGVHLSQAIEPDRSRLLLVHARQRDAIKEATQAKGLVAVPLALYLKHGWAKLEIGIGAGRKNYDKRQLLKERDVSRRIASGDQ